MRADSGFCRPRVLQRLERWGVSYIIGLQKNSRLKQQVELAELALAEQYAAKKTKQRMFGEFEYAAGTWDKPRRVIARLEHGEQGANPRFIVTDLPGSAKALYERRYCARGEAENRIKEAQLDRKRSANTILAPLLEVCGGLAYGGAGAVWATVPGATMALAGRQLCGSNCARSRFFSVGRRSKTSLR